MDTDKQVSSYPFEVGDVEFIYECMEDLWDNLLNGFVYLKSNCIGWEFDTSVNHLVKCNGKVAFTVDIVNKVWNMQPSDREPTRMRRTIL